MLVLLNGHSGQQNLPEGISYTVPEANETLLVFSHEVTSVKVGIPFHQHISHQPFLSQLLVSSITKERADGAHPGQQKSSFPW